MIDTDKNKKIKSIFNIDANVDTIIFDLDGTFYPSWVMGYKLLIMLLRRPRAMFKFYKARKKIRREQTDSLLWTNREDFLLRQAKVSNVKNDYFNKKVYPLLEQYASHFNSYKGVRETLDELREENYRLYVFSDFPLYHKLEKLGIVDCFESAFSSEDSGFLKPDKRAFEYLKTKIPMLCASKTLYVGDRFDIDGQFAKNNGMFFLRVGREWKWKKIKNYLR